MRVRAQTVDGSILNMALRELCGWARDNQAQVQTEDGWPVINGIIHDFGLGVRCAGTVQALVPIGQPPRILAHWEAET